MQFTTEELEKYIANKYNIFLPCIAIRSVIEEEYGCFINYNVFDKYNKGYSNQVFESYKNVKSFYLKIRKDKITKILGRCNSLQKN